jgi:hypothetical protein
LLIFNAHRRSHRLYDAVRFAGVHLLARLLDLLKYCCIVQTIFGCDVRGLAVERDIEGLDTCDHVSAMCTWVTTVEIVPTIKLLEHPLNCA